MGLNVRLEWENKWQPGYLPKVLKTPSYKNLELVEDIKLKQPGGLYQLYGADDNLIELCVSSLRSTQHQSMHCRPVLENMKNDLVHKRGSVYHSSKEVRTMRNHSEGRRDIELDPGNHDDVFLSFNIVDSSPQRCQNEALPSQKERSVSLDPEPKSLISQSIPSRSVEVLDLSLLEKHSDLLELCQDSIYTRHGSSDDLLDFFLHPEDSVFPESIGAVAGRGSFEKQISEGNNVVLSEISGNCFDKDSVYALPKSYSAKDGILNSSHGFDGVDLNSSLKTQFSPLKKILSPIMKSKSLRSPLIFEADGCTPHSSTRTGRVTVLPKSLSNNFLNATHMAELDESLIGSKLVPVAHFSPAHLHATLKLEFKHDTPSFEFFIKDPEDILFSKVWKTDNDFNWIYTIHSSKKMFSSTGRRSKRKQSSLIIGQMNVSCYLCSRVNENGSIDSSIMTEFILYDIMHARRSMMGERSESCYDSVRPTDVPSSERSDASLSGENISGKQRKNRNSIRHALHTFGSNVSSAYPLSSMNLYPQFEVAAIVIEAPFSEMEVPKDTNLKEGDDIKHASVKVITPSGMHGMPIAEEDGPSSLLDRWKHGGGCDCGGWDMACPIVIFDNSGQDNVVCSTSGNHTRMVLFVQGQKENVSALCISGDGKDEYSVVFHAQLSAMQAFSICIAVFHCSQSLTDVKNNTHKLYANNSLKLLLQQEEVKHLVKEAVASKKKGKSVKEAQEIPSSFILDPPFSPMGRA